jgi:hypothetical protein
LYCILRKRILMTVAMSVTTADGIVLIADNGDFFEQTDRLEHRARKVFISGKLPIGFVHSGRAGGSVSGRTFQIKDELLRFISSIEQQTAMPIHSVCGQLGTILQREWREVLLKYGDEISMLVAGYERGRPVCCTLTLKPGQEKRVSCNAAVPSLTSLGGRWEKIDQIRVATCVTQ